MKSEQCGLGDLCGIGALGQGQVDSIYLLLAYAKFSCVFF